ncbi:hypothetical protein BDD12DRAFT_843685 [Trichophaea hybrida]|nr:hypothetical protein BDD12DRAFT_843685 [Trichophaea hybrida]
MSTPQRVRVGILGCGEVTQVIHIPTLTFLSTLFQIVYLCDVSPGSLSYASSRLPHVHKTTLNPSELIGSPDVDVVFILNSDEYHCAHAVAALEAGKHVFIEKPMALCIRDADRIIEAERKSTGRVMVGYMRRYAAVFRDAMEEVGGVGEVIYARVRDIIAPNHLFITQSGTCPERFTDASTEAVRDKEEQAREQTYQALMVENSVEMDDETTKIWRILGSLGSHDLSVMREALGTPTGVHGCHLRFPIWTVLFKYPSFAVTYESGFDDVPRFDAHLEIFGRKKTVKVQYDTPYVKGLPVVLTVREAVGGDKGAYQERTVRRTYEDPYTLELKELWEMVVNGKDVKTTAEDARKDLEVFGMVVRAGFSNRIMAAVSL